MKKNEKLAVKAELNKEIKILLFSIVGILAVALGIYFLTRSAPEITQVTNETAVPENLTRAFNHKTGPDNAKVKIVEFYDPECEACAAFYPYMKEVIARNKDNIQLTVRYALYHGNSVLAAKASDAAGLQGKFWEFQERLFMSANEWSHLKHPASEFFIKYARELGLDTAKFEADMNDLRRMETINIDLEDGPKLGVNGTPTIFINGVQLDRLHPDYFRQKVEEALAK